MMVMSLMARVRIRVSVSECESKLSHEGNPHIRITCERTYKGCT